MLPAGAMALLAGLADGVCGAIFSAGVLAVPGGPAAGCASTGAAYAIGKVRAAAQSILRVMHVIPMINDRVSLRPTLWERACLGRVHPPSAAKKKVFFFEKRTKKLLHVGIRRR
jgi:hypothetical protein